MRYAIVAIAVGFIFFAGAVNSALSAQSNLAYDEVSKFVRGDQPAPQPGTFDADFQAAVDAEKAASSAPQHHGIFGSIMNAAQSARSAVGMISSGIPARVYFMNGWKRTDDPGKESATIERPDKHEIIYLDLAKKTYRIVDTNIQPIAQTPPPERMPPSSGGPPPSPQPGTGKLDISVSSTALGPKTIGNVATNGYSQDFKATETQSTGSCQDGSFETSVVQYLSPYAEPQLAAPRSAPSMTHQNFNFKAATMGLRYGCQPKVNMRTTGGASMPSGRLSLWSLVTLSASGKSTHGQAGGGFSTLTERGNVRVLGAGDASLFQIPSDFTKEQ